MRGKALASGFVDLPYRLYQGDPLWVPPLRSDVHKLISAKTNPFFAEADIENFVAIDVAGTVVGRISATIHHAYNDRFGHEHAFFGLFESVNDPATVMLVVRNGYQVLSLQASVLQKLSALTGVISTIHGSVLQFASTWICLIR